MILLLNILLHRAFYGSNNSSEPITIFDTTLRDGMQTPGIGCDLERRIGIAKEIAKCNPEYIEIGMPANSIDYAMMPHIARSIYDINPDIGIAILCRNVKSDIDKGKEIFAKCTQEKKLAHVFIPTSDALLQNSLGKSKEEVIAKIKEIVPYCRNQIDAEIEFTPEDAAATTDLQFLEDVVSEAINKGAKRINLPDTTGWCDVQDYGELFKHMKTIFSEYTFHTHPHNDSGCAVANAISAVKNGASCIEGTILGIGERAGNVDWMVAAGSLTHKGYSVGCDMKKFYSIATTIATMLGYTIPKNHPLIGENCHRTSSGIHGKAVAASTKSYHHFDPSIIGAPEIELVLGQTSGEHIVEKKLRQMGYVVHSTLNDLTEQIKETGMHKGAVSEEDIRKMILQQAF